MTGHVPPGMAPPLGTRWMYEDFHQKLNSILYKYSNIIIGMHFGHEHNDNFRVFYDEQGKYIVQEKVKYIFELIINLSKMSIYKYTV